VQLLGGQLLDRGGQLAQPDRRHEGRRLLGRMHVRVHGRNLPDPSSNSKHLAENVDNYFSAKFSMPTLGNHPG
jgi:hypothetical protein